MYSNYKYKHHTLIKQPSTDLYIYMSKYTWLHVHLYE